MTEPNPTPEPPATPAELEALAAELRIEEGYLDELVHDAKAAEAADLNNEGLRSQLVYLCEGMSAAGARSYLADYAGSPDE